MGLRQHMPYWKWDLVASCKAWAPSIRAIVWRIVLSRRLVIFFMSIFPLLVFIKSGQCLAINIFVPSPLVLEPDNWIYVPFWGKAIMKYIYAISISRSWYPIINNWWSTSHQLTKCCSNSTWLLIQEIQKNFSNPHSRRATIQFGSWAAWWYSTSFPLSFHWITIFH